jgi:type II secretory pathway component PulK
MKLHQSKLPLNARRENARVSPKRSEGASVLILVLWISIGLVAIALYFANSMTFELRASDNRATGIAAEQAIEGAARYVGWALANFATNGAVPNNTQFSCAAVPVGDAHFWLIGRDPSGTISTEPYFGLVDEASKLNLNRAGTNALSYLPNMTLDFADAIVDWRSTNGSGDYALNYSALGYTDKNSPFETVDELRLVYGATIDLLVGEDVNRNGVLDINEKDLNGNGTLDPGLFEYLTVCSRQPNFHSDGSSLTNVNLAIEARLQTLFQSAGVGNASGLATSIYNHVHPRNGPANPFPGILNFCLFCQNQGMSSADFAKIYYNITTSTNLYTNGLLNINTAGMPVMEALFMGLGVDQNTAQSAAQTLVTYRQQNPNNLTAISWIVDALGNTSPVVQTLENASRDYITTQSFQFTADIAAVGPFGRGYRRVKFVFDISEGAPKIIYRQDLSRLGWALGEKARATWVAKEIQ